MVHDEDILCPVDNAFDDIRRKDGPVTGRIDAYVHIDAPDEIVLRKNDHIIAVEEPSSDQITEAPVLPGHPGQPVSGVEEQRQYPVAERGDYLHVP